jgi:hypothetical protein
MYVKKLSFSKMVFINDINIFISYDYVLVRASIPKYYEYNICRRFANSPKTMR